MNGAAFTGALTLHCVGKRSGEDFVFESMNTRTHLVHSGKGLKTGKAPIRAAITMLFQPYGAVKE